MSLWFQLHTEKSGKMEVRLTWEKSKKQGDESNEREDVKVEMKGQWTGLMRG